MPNNRYDEDFKSPSYPFIKMANLNHSSAVSTVFP